MRGNKEIEKKYLVDFNKIPFDLSKLDSVIIYQQYLCKSGDGIITRIRITEDSTYGPIEGFITIKGRQTGLSRNEFEKKISFYEAHDIMSWSDAPILKKTRYKIPYGNLTIELDIFHGKLDSLIMAEIEFPSEEEAAKFVKPDWFCDDVSSNFTYTNSALYERD